VKFIRLQISASNPLKNNPPPPQNDKWTPVWRDGAIRVRDIICIKEFHRNGFQATRIIFVNNYDVYARETVAEILCLIERPEQKDFSIGGAL